MSKKVVIIGGGIGGLATAALLAKAGLNVTILEKQGIVGGRAGLHIAKGFTFDTGPSWLLMPEIFEHFYRLVGKDMQSELDLRRLTPAYRIFFEEDLKNPLDITGNEEQDRKTFETIEPGSGEKLGAYINRAEATYTIATESFLYTNFTNYMKFLKIKTARTLPTMINMSIRSIDSYVSNYVKDARLKKILEYPMVFLGTSPYKAPALYHLMSYLDFRQGVYYPYGGMYKIIESIESIARSLDVKIQTNVSVEKILATSSKVTGVRCADGTEMNADIVISNADLHFTETALLDPEYQTYPAKYWRKKMPSPGAVLMYLGIKGSLPELTHHNLLFTEDWKTNFGKIFDLQEYPHPASMYICKPTATDKTVAPKNHENIFVLVPVAATTEMTKDEIGKHTESYIDQIIAMTGISDLRERIVYKKIVDPIDFANDLNAWRGSALGLAHPLLQSALWRPRNKSKKVTGLYYVGGNTLPGIGLPMCLIGSELIYKHLANDTSITPVLEIRDLSQEANL